MIAFVAHRDLSDPARHRVVARGAFWQATDADGALLELPRNRPGVRLGSGDVLALLEPDGPLHEHEEVAFTVARVDPAAFVQIDLRDDGASAYRVVVAPGEPVAVLAVWKHLDEPPIALARAQLDGLLDDAFAPLRIAVRLGGDRFAVSVDGVPAVQFQDARLTSGRIALTARDGALSVRAVAASGVATAHDGTRAPFAHSDDLGALRASSRTPARLASLGLALATIAAAACWLAACWHVAVGAAGWLLATAVGLAPLALLLVVAAVERALRPTGTAQEWLEPFAWVAAALGLALAWRVLAASAGSAAKPRRSALAAAVVLAALVGWLAVERRTEALGPSRALERAALALPLPSDEVPANVSLGAGDALTAPGPYRDLELAARVVLEPGSALHVRLRAAEPSVPVGIALVLSADPRRPTSFVREEPWTFEAIGRAGAAVEPTRACALRIVARGRQLTATVDGQLVAQAYAAEPPAGAVVLLAAPGRAELGELELRALPPTSGSPPSSAPVLARSFAAPLLLALLGAALARAIGAPGGAGVCAGAFATLPFAALLAWGTTEGYAVGTAATRGAAGVGLALAAGLATMVASRRAAATTAASRSATDPATTSASRRAPGASSPRGGRLRFALVLACALAAGPAALLLGTARHVASGTAWLNALSFTDWRGERLEGDLLHLTHPLLRRWNYYLAEHRLRGERFAAPKPDGTRRVLVLGGSSTWGFRLPLEQRADWPTQLGALLARDGSLGRVEVLNGAYAGATGDRLYRLLRDGLLAFEPDVVVLSLYYNDSFSLTRGDEHGYYERVTAPGARRGLLGRLADRLAARGARERLEELMAAFARHKQQRTTAQLWTELHGADAAADAPDALFAAMLSRFAELGRREGFALVLVKEPMADDAPKLWRPEFYAAMDAVGARCGVPVVDPGPVLQAGTGALFMDEVHPTPAGNALIAEAVRPVVAELLRQR